MKKNSPNTDSRQMSFLSDTSPQIKRPPLRAADEYGFDLQHYIQGDGAHLYSVQDWIMGVAKTDKPQQAKDIFQSIKKRASGYLSKLVLLPYLASNGRTYQMSFADEQTLWNITHIMARSERRNSILGIPFVDKPSLGYVYIIHVDSINQYKIGMSEDFDRRMMGYSLHLPPALTWVVDCLVKVENFRLVEATLHTQLAMYSIRGEWYQIPENTLSELKKYLKSLEVMV